MEGRKARYLLWTLFAVALILTGVNAKCGDGNIEIGEQCDDGGKQPGDGCNQNCVREIGWNCTGEPSVCNSTCGDGIKVGLEECDDGNLSNNDNCTSTCTIKETDNNSGGSKTGQGSVNAAPIVVPIILVSLAVGCTLIALTIKKHRPETWEKITSVFKRKGDPNASFYATPGRVDEESPKQNTEPSTPPPEKHTTISPPPATPPPNRRTPQHSTVTPIPVAKSSSHQTHVQQSPQEAEFDYTAPPPETPKALPAVANYDTKSAPTDRFFGVPIQSCKQINNVPIIVESCISYLEQHGLKEEGLLRLAGSASQIKQLKEQFDSGAQPDLSQFDLHSITGVLKLYFRELPKVPLIATQGLKDALAAGSPEATVPLIQQELNNIPWTNYYTMKRLFVFLNNLQAYSDVNKMTPGNIAIVWNPTLRISTELIQFLTIWANQIFVH